MSVAEIKSTLQADTLGFLRQWLPEGKLEGHEYQALNPNRSDTRLGSFSINVHSGAWADFADDAKGGDLISLYAYLFCNGDNSVAVKQLAESLRIDFNQGRAKPSQPVEKPKSSRKSYEGWVQVAMTGTSPTPPAAHFKRGKPVMSWTYVTADDSVLGFVLRFEKSDGSKDVLPLTLWQSPQGVQEWRWAGFAEPRPLFNLHALSSRVDDVVLLVEGEKAATAAMAQLADQPIVVSTWLGGSKAINKVDWQPLAGRKVSLWRDADQPGLVAMESIAQTLTDLGCTLFWVEPDADAPEGWDAADWVSQGEPLIDWLRSHSRSFKPAVKSQAQHPVVHDVPDWADGLFRNDKFKPLPVRDNVFQILCRHPEWQGVIGYDEFSSRSVALKDNPCGIVGELDDMDDYRIGNWLANEVGMIVNNAAQITQGVQMAADANRFHPVRDYLESLVWDGQARVMSWIPTYLGTPADYYHHSVGAFFLIGMVARIYQPGCQMQYMPIFEGTQGLGKSTMLKALCKDPEWFSDSPLNIGDKDAYIGIQGVWLQEVAELDAFNKKDATAIKSFITSASDKFREPFGRRDVRRPRQTVFAGTTNQHEYLKDPTGNRRFWPVEVVSVDLDGLKAVRDQLFAEAVKMFKDGCRWAPTREEEAQYFKHVQEDREIQDPREQKVRQFLNQPANQIKDSFTSLEILEGALDTPVSKLDNGRALATIIGGIMTRLGWKKKRSSDRKITYYIKPENWQ
jgi:hypothetical protein